MIREALAVRATLQHSLSIGLALLGLVLAGPATAAVVNVRIEGKGQTLFEGPIRTEAHPIKAASDTQERQCNGTNSGANATPGPTPTTAAVDAMSLIGESFDGQWSSSSEDYFITRWGPEPQNAAEGEYWGVLVEQSFLTVGGCQYELAEGDQVLWALDAFDHNRFLTLYGASENRTGAIPTPTVALGHPFTVKVESFNGNEGTNHTLGPVNGAEISPVATAANGSQTTETNSPQSVTTGTDGTATITFTAPGWHRLKATAAKAFRSNRMDVCVPPSGATGCGPLPADDQVRPTEATHLTTSSSPTGGGETGSRDEPAVPKTANPVLAPAHLQLDGLLLSPIDDRSPRLKYHGSWRHEREPGAWDATVTVGGAGASLTVRLPAGSPVFILRARHRRARVQVLEGTRPAIFNLAAAGAASRLLIAARRTHSGTVTLRILDGTLALDAVAITQTRDKAAAE
jgi:hypothetical protein